MNKLIYLDNSATTRPYDKVINYITDINKNIFANPSSLHGKGLEAEKIIKNAREIIANTLNVESNEIYFTSGGTESNNLAIRGYLDANKRKPKHVVTTKIEHPSVIEIFEYLSANGYTVNYLDVDEHGVIKKEHLKNVLKNETSLISIIMVNNETGTIQQVKEIAKLKNEVDSTICLHVDAVQAYGKMKIHPERMGIDMLSVSSHKIHGPKGAGALFINSNIRVNPIILGGGQESKIRSGTEDVPGIGGFGMASEITHKNIEVNQKHVQHIKTIFSEKLISELKGCKIASPPDSSPYILNAIFKNVKAEVLLHHLEQENIYVSTGSACSSRKDMDSYVLKAMGFKKSEIQGAIRFSFSSFNTNEDVISTVEALKKILPRIRFDKI